MTRDGRPDINHPELARAQGVLSWYQGTARPGLETLAPERLAELDRDAARITSLQKQLGEDRAVCFLGHSGVGKSTLINALVAGNQMILPQGGIGPLTAQATSVRYAETPFFEASYLPPRALNQLVFGLQRHIEAKLRKGSEQPAQTPQAIRDLETEDIQEAEAEAALSAEGEPSDRIEAQIRQARLMVRGNQHADVDIAYLISCLKLALGQEGAEAPPTEEDAERINAIRGALALARSGKPRRCQGSSSDPLLLRQLREHASGHLAPLIKTLEVGWTSPVLKNGVVLVDLPGVGVANDVYREVTQSWVRDRARAIALVVDRSGVTEASAELLRSSGFFGRLLHATDDPAADPVKLLIVVVKLDLVATDARAQEREIDPQTARPWRQHFLEARNKAVELAEAQLRDQLAPMIARELEATGDSESTLLKQMKAALEVHAVSAPEYKKLLVEDEEEPPKIKEPAESGIPLLAAALEGLAASLETSLVSRIEEARRRLGERIATTLDLLRSQWERDDREPEELRRLQSDLEELLPQLRRELHARQGAYREFLSESLPERIEQLVEEAKTSAEREIRRYLGTFKDAHWATLRAAVRRGGTFLGSRHIDLPNDFAIRIDEPIGLIWSKRILASLRSRTSRQAMDYAELVGQLADWAAGQGARVRPKVLRNLVDEIKADSRALSQVGKEAVEELRERVRAELLKKIVGPIRRRCRAFVEAQQDQGPGTKRRILELFSEILPDVVEAAGETAKRILDGSYQTVKREILDVFDKYPDPIERAKQILIASEEDRARKRDAQQRSEVLSLIDTISRAHPADQTSAGPTA